MTPEEFKVKTQEILTNATDQAIVTVLLTELSEEYTKVTANSADIKTFSDKLVEDNEKLRQANMDLFLKVGETVTKEDVKKEIEDDTPTFEALFDEQGNLK